MSGVGELPFEVRATIEPLRVHWLGAQPGEAVGWRVSVEVSVRRGNERLLAADARETASQEDALLLIEPMVREIEARMSRTITGRHQGNS